MGIYSRRGERRKHTLLLSFPFLSQIFKISSHLQRLCSRSSNIWRILVSLVFMAGEGSQHEEGPVPALKWYQGLFEQITRGFRFPPEWDA
ncbi:hypothetical protein Hanom_Chr11g01020351 [Helianthus anomalus]